MKLKRGSCLHPNNKRRYKGALSHIKTVHDCEDAAKALGFKRKTRFWKVKDKKLEKGCHFDDKTQRLTWNRHRAGKESNRKHRESLCCLQSV